jgi:hypothetical protein
MTQQMGFHSPVTNDYSDVWDECRCWCLSAEPDALVWLTQYSQIQVVIWDLSANGWHHATRFWRQKLVMNILRANWNVQSSNFMFLLCPFSWMMRTRSQVNYMIFRNVKFFKKLFLSNHKILWRKTLNL